VQDYAVHILLATHPDRPESPALVKKAVRYGASPRGLQAMVLAAKIFAVLDGRYHVSRADIDRAAPPTLRHRIVLNFEGEAEGLTPDRILKDVLTHVAQIKTA
jgi:MoxR-like ATPase